MNFPNIKPYIITVLLVLFCQVTVFSNPLILDPGNLQLSTCNTFEMRAAPELCAQKQELQQELNLLLLSMSPSCEDVDRIVTEINAGADGASPKTRSEIEQLLKAKKITGTYELFNKYEYDALGRITQKHVNIAKLDEDKCYSEACNKEKQINFVQHMINFKVAEYFKKIKDRLDLIHDIHPGLLDDLDNGPLINPGQR